MAENDKETMKDMHHSIIENKKTMQVPLNKHDKKIPKNAQDSEIMETEEPITMILNKLKEKREKTPVDQRDFLDENG